MVVVPEMVISAVFVDFPRVSPVIVLANDRLVIGNVNPFVKLLEKG